MQELLTAYLLQHDDCPLPGVGALLLKHVPATFEDAGKSIIAPQSRIEFSRDNLAPGELYSFIAAAERISEAEAEKQVLNFTDQITYLPNHGTITLDGLGNFYREGQGKLNFKETAVSRDLLPDIAAEKLLRKNETHAMLVGDVETTNSKMSEYFAEEDKIASDKWWIWAIVIFVVSAALITWHYSSFGSHNNFGNHQPF